MYIKCNNRNEFKGFINKLIDCEFSINGNLQHFFEEKINEMGISEKRKDYPEYIFLTKDVAPCPPPIGKHAMWENAPTVKDNYLDLSKDATFIMKFIGYPPKKEKKL